MTDWICRNMTSLLLLAAFQGLVVFPNMGIQYFFLIDLKLTPGQLSIFNGIINYVWVLKALFGFIVDSFYFYGYRRKSNLLFFSILCSIGWFSMGFYVDSLVTAVITKLTINICLGFINTINEAIMVEMSISSIKSESAEDIKSIIQKLKIVENDPLSVEIKDRDECFSDGDIENKDNCALLLTPEIFKTPKEECLKDNEVLSNGSTDLSDSENNRHKKATNYVSYFMAATSLFSMIAIFLGGLFLEIFPKTLLFKLTLVLCIIPIVVVFILYEKKKTKEKLSKKSKSLEKSLKSSKCKLLRENFKVLKEYLKQGFIFKPVLFIFLVLLNPSVDSVMFSYQATKLNFTPLFISFISVATSISNIFAIFIYKKYLFNIDLKIIITFTTIGFCVFNGLKLVIVFGINEQIGISSKVFYLISDCLYSFANEIHLMPIMIVACRICPKKVEATVFEFIMSIVNLGYLISYQSGGFLADLLGITIEDFSNLWIQVLISSLFPLIVLSAIFIIPSDFSEKVEAFSKKISKEENDKISIFDRRGSDNLNDSGNAHQN